MGVPKYIPYEKKVPYNIRMQKKLLNRLNKYSDLTGKTTTDVVSKVLADFMRDKTVDNDYLNIGGKAIKIPLWHMEKEKIINNKSHLESLTNTFNEVSKDSYSNTIEIKRIPNNLDEFISESYRTRDKGLIQEDTLHSGIEFFIFPDAYNYLENTGIDCIYCFYFEVMENLNNYVYLIDPLVAINTYVNCNNTTMKNQLVSCMKEIDEIDETASESDIFNQIKAIADKYNTGNIVLIGENIDNRIVEDLFDANPKKLDEIYDAIEVIQKQMDMVIEENNELKKVIEKHYKK